jgi:nucleoside-diphosphate-sugar epimerase
MLDECVRNVDAVVHCAGAVRANSQADYFKANVDITKRLAESVLRANPNLKRFIFISSQAALGPSKSEKPKTLDEQPAPVSDYGLSKLEAENEIKRLFAPNPAYTILRPASVYGPRDKDIFIFFALVHRHLAPKPLKKRKVQLVFVKDIAKAVALSLDSPKSAGKTYFLADQKAYDWGEIAQIIAKNAKKFTVPIPLPDLVFHLAGWTSDFWAKISKKPAVLNNQKVKEMLQMYWIGDNLPAKTDLNLPFVSLEKGSEITYNWYINNRYL